MTPERLQEIRAYITGRLDVDVPTIMVRELLIERQFLEAEIVALRRGQGTAPAPAGPGTVAFHVTDPIPDSTGGTR